MILRSVTGAPLLALALIAGCAFGPEQRAITANMIPASASVTAAPVQTLAERQAFYGIPSVSITVVRNGAIAWSRGFGADRNPRMLFQAASLSKSVAAAGLLDFAARRGIDPEAEIGPSLHSFELARIRPAGVVVSLYGLLAHKLGAAPAGYPGYDMGNLVPTLAELLAGAPRANSPPLTFDPAKVGSFNYGGAGYELAELWSEDVSGEPFGVWMERELLRPLHMNDSTFGEPRAPVAHGYWSADEEVEGGWRTYPEKAATGLWTTSPDFARFLIALMDAESGRPSPLSSRAARMMTARTSPNYGLGVSLQTADPERIWFSNGGNAGYKTFYAAFPDRRDAIVILTNGEGGYPLTQEILASASKHYGWPSLTNAR